jgi:hypothetical protein
MSVEPMRVKLILDTQERDPERTDEDLHFLVDELVQLDALAIERESTGAAPPGTRGAGDLGVGLLIALGGSGATLPVLVGLVRDWLGRRGSGVIRLKIGDDEIEMTHVSSATQQRALDEFLSRHQE